MSDRTSNLVVALRESLCGPACRHDRKKAADEIERLTIRGDQLNAELSTFVKVASQRESELRAAIVSAHTLCRQHHPYMAEEVLLKALAGRKL